MKKAKSHTTKRRRVHHARPVRRSRTRRSGSLGAIKPVSILGVVAGAILAGVIDKPLSNVIDNGTIRGAIKAGVGVFLSGRSGFMGNLGTGMVAAGGLQVVQNLMPNMAGAVPALISGTSVPALISGSEDVMGYTSDSIADEFGYEANEISGDMDEISDEFGYDAMEIGYTEDELSGIV